MKYVFKNILKKTIVGLHAKEDVRNKIGVIIDFLSRDNVYNYSL